jgi:hypothetical protein
MRRAYGVPRPIARSARLEKYVVHTCPPSDRAQRAFIKIRRAYGFPRQIVRSTRLEKMRRAYGVPRPIARSARLEKSIMLRSELECLLKLRSRSDRAQRSAPSDMYIRNRAVCAPPIRGWNSPPGARSAFRKIGARSFGWSAGEGLELDRG